MAQPTAQRRSGSYTLSTEFFNAIDNEEKAYFLGFLAADGYVSKSGKAVACCVVVTDVHILEDMRSALGSNAPIRPKTRTKASPNSQEQCVVTFSSRPLVSDLGKYGIVAGKTRTLTYPDLPPSQERHFLRGYMDGNGWVGARQFVMTGPGGLLDGANLAIAHHTGIHLTASRTSNGHPRLVGSRMHTNVIRWIYADAHCSLRRKQQMFLEHWQ